MQEVLLFILFHREKRKKKEKNKKNLIFFTFSYVGLVFSTTETRQLNKTITVNERVQTQHQLILNYRLILIIDAQNDQTQNTTKSTYILLKTFLSETPLRTSFFK